MLYCYAICYLVFRPFLLELQINSIRKGGQWEHVGMCNCADGMSQQTALVAVFFSCGVVPTVTSSILHHARYYVLVARTEKPDTTQGRTFLQTFHPLLWGQVAQAVPSRFTVLSLPYAGLRVQEYGDLCLGLRGRHAEGVSELGGSQSDVCSVGIQKALRCMYCRHGTVKGHTRCTQQEHEPDSRNNAPDWLE